MHRLHDGRNSRGGAGSDLAVFHSIFRWKKMSPRQRFRGVQLQSLRRKRIVGNVQRDGNGESRERESLNLNRRVEMLGAGTFEILCVGVIVGLDARLDADFAVSAASPRFPHNKHYV